MGNPNIIDQSTRPLPALGRGSIVAHRYEVIRALGSGGAGSAYLVRDLVWGTEVALKLLTFSQPTLLDSFRSEFWTLSRIIHPNLARVFDYGVTRAGTGEDQHFYTARAIDGATLYTFGVGKTWDEVLPAVADTVRALAFLHQLKIRHGDVKGSNVLVDKRGQGVLLDLGCSYPFGRNEIFVGGTPGFIPPELLASEEADGRADLFSFGVMLERLCARLSRPPGEWITRLTQRLTQPNVADRPLSAEEVLDVLGVPALSSVIPTESPRLLGRTDVLNTFNTFLSSFMDEQPGARVLWVRGPQGVGVSRLLREMKWTAQLRTTVIEGNARSAGGFVDMLRRATGDASLGSSLVDVLSARDRLAVSGSPYLFVLDDIDQLDAADQQFLVAFVRNVSTSDRISVVGGTHGASPVQTDASVELELAPLSPSDVADWSQSRISLHNQGTFYELTGGYPGLVQTFLSRLATGGTTEEQLGDGLTVTTLDSQRLAGLGTLSPPLRRTLGLVAALGGVVSDVRATALGLAEDNLAALSHEWITGDSSGVRLERVADASAILSAVSERERRDLHREVADMLERTGTESRLSEPMHVTRHRAELMGHLVGAHELDQAEKLVLASKELFDRAPRAWVGPIEALVTARASAANLLLAADVCESAGLADRALHWLAKLRRLRPAGRTDAQMRLRAASIYLGRGKTDRALRHLHQALEAASLSEQRGSVLGMMSRVHFRRGEFQSAQRTALDGLSTESLDSVVADLRTDAGLAATYLGDYESARTHLEQAAQMHHELGRPRAQVRSISYIAVNEYKRGNVVGAMAGYRRALGIAEAHGLSDQICSTAINLGTTAHQRGEWGSALSFYERALRIGSALGKMSTVAAAEFNLARLYADIGFLDRAVVLAERSQKTAESGGMRHVVGAVLELRGDVAVLQGDPTAAREHFSVATRVFLETGASREVSDVSLQLARLDVDAGDFSSAQERLRKVMSELNLADAADVGARANAVGALLASRQADAARVEVEVESAARLAEQSQQLPLQGDVAVTASLSYSNLRDTKKAEQSRAKAIEIWRMIGSSLPIHFAETFWAHPRRRDLFPTEAPTSAAVRQRERGSTSGLAERWKRLAEINKRLNSALDVGRVLEAAMDAAVELTGAERGYILFKDKDGPRIGVARDYEHQTIAPKDAKISWSIAEQVFVDRQPVVTGDAQLDKRFSEKKSVHIERLRSVVAVPVASAEELLAVLYLENRAAHDQFHPGDIELVQMFADQLAIALSNARLHAELAQRTKELNAEKERNALLIGMQAGEIERLSVLTRNQLRSLEYRYDYRGIVGSGPAMRKVFGVLERVIQSNVSVLVLGESGCGKEMIARSIHFNSPRKDKPFIAVNCGAVPEALLESELFGHVKGAFTGADRDRQGLFVAAQGGTLFLDELGEMPLSMQVKLLRVLQEREVRPVGAQRAISIDVRVVCATNRDLRDEIEEERFREDLFYRVAVVELQLPPLRERPEDIPLLVRHFLERISAQQGRDVPQISKAALRRLMEHSWPGNIRELENVMTKALLLMEGEILQAEDLGVLEAGRARKRAARAPMAEPARTPMEPERKGAAKATWREDSERQEAERIRETLEANQWNVREVGRILGIPRATLYRKLQAYGLHRKP